MAVITAAAAGGQNVVWFLDLIGWSEGTTISPLTKDDGYDVIVRGVNGPSIFTSYVDHPFADGRPPVVVRRVPLIRSTAAGRYQILYHYFEAYKLQLHLPDFGPLSQDRVAIEMVRECRAIDDILNGDIADAIVACSSRWASLPGNSYGQGGKTLVVLRQKWTELIGDR